MAPVSSASAAAASSGSTAMRVVVGLDAPDAVLVSSHLMSELEEWP
jgi:hypothetical protein